jgi:hypothetical protein
MELMTLPQGFLRFHEANLGFITQLFFKKFFVRSNLYSLKEQLLINQYQCIYLATSQAYN